MKVRRLVAAAAILGTLLTTTSMQGAKAQTGINRNGTLRVAWDFGTGTWDAPSALGGPEGAILSHVYDRVVHTNPAGEITPGIAESWSFNPQNTVLTLKIRRGLKFTDGSVLDAKAVVASLNRARTVSTSTVRALMTNISAVEAPNPTTVVIRQKAPDVTTLALLADRSGMVMHPNFGRRDFTSKPIGSGMYRVSSARPGIQYKLERNPDYWDVKNVTTKTVVWHVIQNGLARLNALRTNAVDIAKIDGEQFAEMDKSAQSKLRLVTGPSALTGTLQVSAARVPAWRNPKVRKAVSLAINRDAITKALLFGAAKSTVQIVPPGHWAYDKSLDAHKDFDVERAQRLMKEAGFEDGFTINAVSANTRYEPIATALQQMLAKINIKFRLRFLPGTQAGVRMWTEKVEDSILSTASNRADPALTYQALYTAGQSNNPANLTNGRVDRLIKQTKAEPNQAKRAVYFKQLAALIEDDPLGIIPVWSDIQALAMQRNVVGYRIHFLNAWINLEGAGITR